jgi:hypothetical protein
MLNKWKGSIILSCLLTICIVQSISAQSNNHNETILESDSPYETVEQAEDNFEEDAATSEETQLDEQISGPGTPGPEINKEEESNDEMLHSAEQDLFGWAGVNAEIDRVVGTSKHGSASVRVETANEEADEGVVLAESSISPNTDYQYSVYVKGEGDVYLKIEETNIMGRFLKETRSEPFTLTDDWKKIDLNIKTVGETAQVDLFILTSSKQKAVFYADMVQFKELK